MEIGWLATICTWLFDKFSKKREKVENKHADAQKNKFIFNHCNFDKSSFLVIKESAQSMVKDISKEFGLPLEKAKENQKIIDGSYSEESLIYNIGAVSGSTATASGVPYERVNNYANEWWSSKYQLVCANCRTPRNFDKSKGAASYVCSKCSADIFTLEPRQ